MRLLRGSVRHLRETAPDLATMLLDPPPERSTPAKVLNLEIAAIDGETIRVNQTTITVDEAAEIASDLARAVREARKLQEENPLP